MLMFSKFFIMPHLHQRGQNRAFVFWGSYTLNGNSYCDELAFVDVNLFIVLARVFKKLKIGGNRKHHRAHIVGEELRTIVDKEIQVLSCTGIWNKLNMLARSVYVYNDIQNNIIVN